MYTKFNVSLLLALFAYTPLAIRLGARQDDEAVPNIAGAEEIVSGSEEDEGVVTSVLEDLVEEATLEEIEEDDADP